VDATGSVHSFGATNYNPLTATSSFISLKWSDPLGASTNDYDLFILNSTGTAIKGFSVTRQTGAQDPFEAVGQGSNCGTASASGYCPATGDRIVVVLFNGNARALRIDTNRGVLGIQTAGSTFGHNGGQNTVTMAATAWNSAHAGTKAFSGFANPIETFSSDGPRKIFYNPNGSAITAGNFLFNTNGGTTLSKPDLTAADGVFAATPGFLPFFGTSAAAPHAAAIAALVKSAAPSLSAAQILALLKSTALDTMAVGIDRDSGSGIVMALQAVQAAMAH
jgi:subtilisin family serine protease